MYKRTLLTALSLVALAAVVATTANAAYGKKASKTANSAVQVEVFSPRKGDVAGKQSKGFFVDLALRYPSLAASGADFQLTGPTTHQNQAPFPGAFAPGVDEKVPGLIVLLSTTHGRCQERSEPRQPLQPDRLHEPEDERDLGHLDRRGPELRQERPLGAAGRGRGRQEQGRDLQRRPSGRSRRQPRRPHQRGRPRGVRSRLEYRGRAVRDPRLSRHRVSARARR